MTTADRLERLPRTLAPDAERVSPTTLRSRREFSLGSLLTWLRLDEAFRGCGILSEGRRRLRSMSRRRAVPTTIGLSRLTRGPSLGDGPSRLRALDDRKLVWHCPEDPVVEQVIVPALQQATEFDCMVGFFGGGALRELAAGLATYLLGSTEPLRLLVSPVISEADQESIREGLKKPREVLESSIAAAFQDEVALASALADHTKRCLAYLLAVRRLQMKVVLLKGGAKFHLKEWIFKAKGDVVVLSGSANFTGAALTANVEQLHLLRSWRGSDSLVACDDAVLEFEEYWGNRKPNAVAIDCPLAVREGLVSSYDNANAPTESDYRRALELEGIDQRAGGLTVDKFHPPDGLVWETGKYGHQGRAVRAWEAADRRGILSMATGAGKTIAALVSAWRLYRETRSLLVVIAAPTRPLVTQWGDEVRTFGIDAYMAGKDSRRRRLGAIDRRLTNLELGVSKIQVIIVTNDLLTDREFKSLVGNFRGPSMLIADEVHNLGTRAFLSDPPEYFDYRLGLSATPQRQYDEEGTAGLVDFFGDTVFDFGLKEAIGVCLVPYEYHLHPVSLTDDEVFEYRRLSEQIRKLMQATGGEPRDLDAERLQKLLNRRRLVLENAEGKLAALAAALMEIGPSKLTHTLIYATDKGPSQLERVNALLRDLNVKYHQITASETGDPRLVEATLAAFQRGVLQVLTAKRVLDEGLNVPEIRTAYILASTTVRRQWVQRRGRLLRTCPAIGKSHATIHDFVVLPPPGEPRDDDIKRLVNSELERCDEFTELATNRASKGGPREVLQDIRLRYLI